MTTIGASTTLGIVLDPASYTSPVVIAAGVSIANTAGAAVAIAGVATYFAIRNYGTITGTGASVGIYLLPGGSITNRSASISGYPGIEITGGNGVVINAGGILGTGTAGRGIILTAGGSVTNAASATIAGGNDGVAITGDVGAVENFGSIAGTGTSANQGTGVLLADGGSVTNAAAAAITGTYRGVQMAGAGSVVNYGRIIGTGTNRDGVALLAGGTVSNAASAVITGGFVGVFIYGTDATVVNAGSIAGTIFTTAVGIALFSDGSVTNQASGIITGVYCGINMGSPPTTGPGDVANYGGITGTGTASIGVRLLGGGVVTNANGATISGISDGIYIKGGAGFVANSGSILGTGTVSLGIDLHANGSISNAAFGAIAGHSYGVRLFAGGTLANAGEIVGSSGTAVSFGGTGSNLLLLYPGFGFSGLVIGSGSAANTLGLASAISVGTISGLGSRYLNFGPVVLDAGARWLVSGDTVGLAGTISGFAAGDTIQVTDVVAIGSSFSNGILTLDEAVGSATLDLPGTFSLKSFVVTTGAGSTSVSLSTACFCIGTRLLTVSGEVAVEALAPGDLVMTITGRLRPVRWIGFQHIEPARPVRVLAHAFGHGMPHRDLLLSPDHAVFIDGALIPIRYLVNGATISEIETDAVSYWHIELDRHDIVLAEGLPSESYLDTGNRAAFDNGGGTELSRVKPVLAQASKQIHHPLR